MSTHAHWLYNSFMIRFLNKLELIGPVGVYNAQSANYHWYLHN